jgi:hypothetical protein
VRSASAAVLALALVAVAPRAAAGFPTGAQFDDDALTLDGGGGVFFTGAPRFTNHTCDVCHLEPPRRIGLSIEAPDSQVDLFTAGYQPGATYQLRVALAREWAGTQYHAGDNCGASSSPFTPCNDNGFALEVDDQDGRPVGGFQTVVAGQGCQSAPAETDDYDVYVAKDGHGVASRGFHHGVGRWDLCWTAPGSGTGPVSIYVAAVDGGGGDGTMANPNDNINDDVFSAVLPLGERGGAAPPGEGGGCAAGGDSRGAGLAAALLLLAAVLGLGGCATVKPYQREHLAKRIMKFAPDPQEDELDLHMLEAREGSTGGYGSAGGGCGCN